MNRWLLWKELREVAVIALLGFAVCLIIAASEMNVRIVTFFLGGSGSWIPFASAGWLSTLWMVAGILGIVLGLRQSAWEDYTGAYRFLLHRPLSRERIVLHKLAVGLTVLGLASGIPLLLLIVWAARPDTHASPFFFGMTISAWQAWLSLGLFYLAGFLCGLRPARWLGTRLLPLAAAFCGYFMLQVLSFQWFVWCAIFALSVALLLAAIFTVATTRDYA